MDRSLLEHQSDVDQELNADEENEEGEVEIDAAEAQRWHESSNRLDRRVGNREDAFHQDEERTPRLPVAREDSDEVEDESTDQDKPIEPQDGGKNLTDGAHALSTPITASLALIEEAVLLDLSTRLVANVNIGR